MWTCSECGETIDEQFDACWRCAESPEKDVAHEEVGEEEAPDRVCPDCSTSLTRVQVLDAMGDQGDRRLSYAAVTTKRAWFFGHTKSSGTIWGYMCPSCGRILLYGLPKP